MFHLVRKLDLMRHLNRVWVVERLYIHTVHLRLRFQCYFIIVETMILWLSTCRYICTHRHTHTKLTLFVCYITGPIYRLIMCDQGQKLSLRSTAKVVIPKPFHVNFFLQNRLSCGSDSPSPQYENDFEKEPEWTTASVCTGAFGIMKRNTRRGANY